MRIFVAISAFVALGVGSPATAQPEEAQAEPERLDDPQPPGGGAHVDTLGAEEQESASGVASGDVAAANWYIPGPRDRNIPWNTHDPWLETGTSRRVSLHLGFDSFIDVPSTADDSASEIGLRFEGAQWGAYAGLLSAGDLYAFGISMFRHRAHKLYDHGIPDFSAGVLYPSVDVKVATDFDDTNIPSAVLWPTGARFVWEDAVVVDARVQLPGLWVEPKSETVFWSWGLSLETGLVF